MVSLKTVQTSNSLITSSLPQRLVAVFVGATSGIGETSLKQFAKHTRQPRAYFIGRSQTSADRILAECKALNPLGEYEFMKSDVSLMRNVDEVCKKIAEKEKEINILFMSQGIISFSKYQTEEKLEHSISLIYYSRMRFITNLLPLLKSASSLRRVVTVLAGTKEGPIWDNDFQCADVSILKIGLMRGHLVSMVDFGLEVIAEKSPTVSFVHTYPGFVDTGIMNKTPGVLAAVARGVFGIISVLNSHSKDKYVPIEECGERHLYFATSARYRPVDKVASGIPLGEEVAVAKGTDGIMGSGVYAVDEFGETAGPEVEKLLRGMRKDGIREKVWQHTQSEFKRIFG